MSPRPPTKKPAAREDTRSIRLTPAEMGDAETVRCAIGEVSATGVVRALLRVARLAVENGDKIAGVGDLLRILARESRVIRDAAEKPAPVALRGRARKSKAAR